MTVRRKKAAPKTSDKPARRRARPAIKKTQKEELLSAEATLRSVVEDFQAHLDDQVAMSFFAQDDMSAALLFGRLAKLSGEGAKLFDVAVLEAYDEGAGDITFEPGRIVCTVNKTERRAPQWKEEAAKLAEKLHEVAEAAQSGDLDAILALTKGYQRHDRKGWEKTVAEGYEPTVSYKPKLTEGL